MNCSHDYYTRFSHSSYSVICYRKCFICSKSETAIINDPFIDEKWIEDSLPEHYLKEYYAIKTKMKLESIIKKLDDGK